MKLLLLGGVALPDAHLRQRDATGEQRRHFDLDTCRTSWAAEFDAPQGRVKISQPTTTPAFTRASVGSMLTGDSRSSAQARSRVMRGPLPRDPFIG
jgi:hypothetical protein